MRNPEQGLEAISVRRTSFADGDKVRYRVYKNPSEFVAVIAESALMAVRVSGVTAPYKILRDMPSQSIAVEAQRIADPALSTERINFQLQRTENSESKAFAVELPERDASESVLFVPMGLADLQSRGMTRARILPAEMLQEIIEEHARKTQASEPIADENIAHSFEPEPEPEVAAPPPVQSDAERLTQMANELLPPTSISSAAEEQTELSPEEVEKLLNG